MYDTAHPVYPQLQSIGREITSLTPKPKAVLVFSAHWSSESTQPDTIQINTSEHEPLLYDFYGFPRHYYMEKYANVGSKVLAERVMEVLSEQGIKSEGVERGLDHGVFVCFKVAFEEKGNPLGVPVVQVSLWGDDDGRGGSLKGEGIAEKHIRLGRAVEKLREEGVVIVVSGMAVHNLRDFIMSGGRSGQKPRDYTTSFDEALKVAAETEPGDKRDQAMADLLKRADVKKAHPTPEHLLPMHVGVGAAGMDQGQRLWTMGEGGMSWAQYRWGAVES